MHKTTFHINKMDCPSEEQIIRMSLSENPQILSLHFDIPNRKLTVYHEGPSEPILSQLEPLNFQTTLTQTELSREKASPETEEKSERKLLLYVLLINAGFFLLEWTMGWWYHSMGLVADSLDMLADSMVYGLALLAIGRSTLRKKRTAKAAGYLQLLLAFWGIIEVVRRFINQELLPDANVMMLISFLALLGNLSCLYLLQKTRSKEAHMQASMIFTSNDIIINAGVIGAGLLVGFTESLWPDLIVGTVVFLIVLRGAVRILKL